MSAPKSNTLQEVKEGIFTILRPPFSHGRKWEAAFGHPIKLKPPKQSYSGQRERKRETSSSKRGVVNKGLSRVSAPETGQIEKNCEFWIVSHTLDNTIILGQAFPEMSLLNNTELRNVGKYPEISYKIVPLMVIPLFSISTLIASKNICSSISWIYTCPSNSSAKS